MVDGMKNIIAVQPNHLEQGPQAQERAHHPDLVVGPVVDRHFAHRLLAAAAALPDLSPSASGGT